MRRITGLIFVFTSVFASLLSGAAYATTPGEFLSVYVDQLGKQETLRTRIPQDLRNPSAGQLKDCSEAAIALATALGNDAKALRTMTFQGDLAKIVPTLASLNETKAVQQLQYGALCSTMAKSPAGSKTYLQMAGAGPAVQAHIATTDRVIFQGMPLIAAAVLPPGSDIRNPKTHLTIKKAERNKLVTAIDKSFADAKKPLPAIVKENNNDFLLAAVAILRAFLADHKGSDEA
jgi:hypothetical protein